MASRIATGLACIVLIVFVAVTARCQAPPPSSPSPIPSLPLAASLEIRQRLCWKIEHAGPGGPGGHGCTPFLFPARAQVEMEFYRQKFPGPSMKVWLEDDSYQWQLDHPHFSAWPRPYLAGSANLMPPGYAPFALGFGGGVMLDQPHFLFDSFLGYDRGHKEDDGTNDNYGGHDRFARAFAAYRFPSPKLSHMFIGVGARWSQLSTTNYVKGAPVFSPGAWHPEVGVGWELGAVARLQTLYMFHPSHEVTYYPDQKSCDGCGNGSQGLDFSITFPSPLNPQHRHIFWRTNVVLFRFHDTITNPSDPILTREQAGQGHWGDSTEFMLLYRF